MQRTAASHPLPELMDRILAFAEQRYREGGDGQIIVAGVSAESAVVAFALGVADDEQAAALETFARVLFEHHGVQCYAVAIPAWESGSDNAQPREVVAVTGAGGPERYQRVCAVRRDAAGRVEALEPGPLSDEIEALTTDLLQPLERVPGTLLRTVLEAYEDVRVELPGTGRSA
jgi:hypothetical protein